MRQREVHLVKQGKVTAKDVAARAGVSPTTVSMILSGKGADVLILD